MTTAAADIEWSVFSLSVARANPRVIASDIEAALQKFRAVTGKEPKSVALNSKLSAVPVPPGIGVVYSGGCMGFEVWVSDVVVSVESQEDYESWLNKMRSRAQKGGQ